MVSPWSLDFFILLSSSSTHLFFFGMCMGLQGFKFSFPKGHNRCFYTELKASSNAWLSTKVTAKGW